MRRFEFSEGTSNKFWEVEQDGSDLNIRWGRIGTQGQSQTKSFASEAAAKAAMTKLIEEKVGKGYAEIGAAAGAAIGKTAAKPKVEAPAAPPEVVAPAPIAPAPIAIDPGIAPWLANGEPFVIPAKLLAQALPSRRFPAGVKPGGDPALVLRALGEAIADNAKPSEEHSTPSMAPVLMDAWQRLRNPSPQPVAHPADAAMLALVFGAAPHFYPPIDVTSLVDMLVARDGLPAAVDLLLVAERDFDVELKWQGSADKRRITFHANQINGPLAARWGCPASEGEWAFRRHLSAASAEDYAACVERIRAALPSLHPARRVAMALLLPDEPELSNTLAIALDAAGAPEEMLWLHLTATDPAAFAAIARNPHKHYTHIFDNEKMVGTLLQERGMSMLEALLPWAEVEVVGHALAAFGVPEAIDALAREAGSSKGALARLSTAVERWPLAAIVALSKIAAGNSKDVALVSPILAGLLRAHETAIPALRPWLGAAAEATVDKMLALISGPIEIADVADLPIVLANPPWLATRKKTAIAAITDIAPLDLAPVVDWKDSEREAAMRSTRNEPENDECLALQLGFDKRNVAHKPILAAGVKAIQARDADALIAQWRLMKQTDKAARSWSYISVNGAAIAQLPDAMAIAMWNAIAAEGDYEWGVEHIVAKHGIAALPGFMAVLSRRPQEYAPLAIHFGVVALAAPMARALRKLKKAREPARAWLSKFPEHAACGLIPAAIGKPGEVRDAAGMALRMLAAEGHQALLLDVAARYARADVSAAVEAMLAEDPLDRFPGKRAPLPAFWQPLTWRRPVLASGASAGKALSPEALDALGTMLMFPTTEGLYAGIDQVRAACTPESLADFAWDCFATWLSSGAPSKEGWALASLGLFGNDETARKLTPYLRAWPGEAQHARAVSGLDVLEKIGTDVALMLLNGIAQKLKFKGLQDKAREKIAQIAEARGLTTEELEDRLAPDLGLDEHGTMLLDFGTRTFRVGFDETLKPYVRDADGARLPDLPKPKKTDDAALSKDATERFKLLKKDARTIASQQVLRLELAMCARRRWHADVFRIFLAEHPLVRHLVQRLAWGVYSVEGEGAYGGTLRACFRVTEDGSLATANDDAFVLPEGDDIRIGLPHPLELDATTAAAFAQVFADYELLQPFAQLGRETHTLTDEERKLRKLERWKGAKVPTGRVLGLVNKGWRRGEAQDGGGIWYFNKPLGGDRVIELNFEPGITVGYVDGEPEQTLQEVQFGKPSEWGELKENEPLAALDPIAASELIRDLESLRA